MLGAFYSAYISRESLALTKTTVDAANEIISKHSDSLTRISLALTNQSVEAAKKSVIISETSLKHSDSINREANNISEQSLMATREMVADNRRVSNTNIESIKDVNRAYLIISEMNVVKYQIDTLLRIDAVIKNLGATPAYKTKAVNIVSIVSTLDVNPEKLFEEQKKTDTTRITEITVGANQEFYQPFMLPYMPSSYEHKLLIRRKLYLIVIVNLEYYDIFNRKHFTHAFSYFNYGAAKFFACTTYNDTN